MKRNIKLKTKNELKIEDISKTEKLLMDIKEAINQAKKEDLKEIKEIKEELMNKKKRNRR